MSNHKPVLRKRRFGIRTTLNAAFLVFGATGILLSSASETAGALVWIVVAVALKLVDVGYERRVIDE